ncbi:phosphatase PAP2 family protein [Microbacterium lacticum]|uniref:phosphatase PAP2 family protein n=1 Tax=Microbacterium lacticum TaxID=33885 RepID=UPI0018B0528A|nr:phosphatase PAP2 family protein [Microbacterium lacticum]MBF9335161.1 phosphatase PAP2 family protein [Microbacterium lacticum]
MSAPVDDEVGTTGLQRLVIGVVLIVLAIGLGIQITLEVDIDIDDWWNSFVDVFSFLRPLALVLNFLGGGWFATFVVPLGTAAILLALRRPWGALFALCASAGSALIVQVLKAMFGRARPEDMIVVSDHGSYPSGHTANAATLAVIAVVIVPRLWVAIVGAAWVFAMAFSRTGVHAHWFTDTVGGTLAGLGAALVVAAFFTPALDSEARRPDR